MLHQRREMSEATCDVEHLVNGLITVSSFVFWPVILGGIIYGRSKTLFFPDRCSSCGNTSRSHVVFTIPSRDNLVICFHCLRELEGEEEKP